MRRPRLILRLLPIAAALLLTTSCADDTSSLTSPSSTTPSEETFTGTLTVNGAFTHAPITVLAPNTQITARLSSLSPDPAQLVGLALGSWNAAAQTCQVVLSNDSATQGTAIVGEATVSGTFCVRLYDSTGKVPTPEAYTISVLHQ